MEQSAIKFKALASSNTNPTSNTSYAVLPKAIWVGAQGSVKVKDVANTIVTFLAVPAGTLLPIRPKYILRASTANNFVGLY